MKVYPKLALKVSDDALITLSHDFEHFQLIAFFTLGMIENGYTLEKNAIFTFSRNSLHFGISWKKIVLPHFVTTIK